MQNSRKKRFGLWSIEQRLPRKERVNVLFCMIIGTNLVRRPQCLGRQTTVRTRQEFLEAGHAVSILAEPDVTLSDFKFHPLLVVDPASAIGREMLTPIGRCDDVKLRCNGMPSLYVG